MDARRLRRMPPKRPPSVLEWLFVRLVVAAMIVALGIFGWRYLTVDRLDEEIRLRVEAKFQRHYQGLLVSIDSARRIEGEGIELHGLTICEPNASDEPAMLEVDQIFVSCTTDLAELVTEEPQASNVVFRRVQVNAVRRANGSWNVAQLFPPPKFSEHSPPVSFEACTVSIVDQSLAEPTTAQWRDLHLTLTPDPDAAASLGLEPAAARQAIRVAGGMTGDHFREVRLSGEVDFDSKRWHIHGEVEQLAFTPEMRKGLPRDLAQELAPIAAVSGNTQLRFDADNLAPDVAPIRFRVIGEISEGRIDDERLPLPLTDVAARLFADNQGVHIKELKARLGNATIESSLKLDGYESTSPMVIRIGATGLLLDEELAGCLPEEARKLWNQLLPVGEMSGELTLAFDGRNWNPDLVAQLKQLTFEYVKFPYRMTDGEATLKLQNDRLTVTGKAWAGNSPVKFEAEVRDAGPNWSGWMEARSEEAVPVDDRLLSALAPHTREVVQSFSPRGYVQLVGRLDRRPGAKHPAHSHIEVEFCDCSINYRHFPYTIDHVTGTLRGTDGIWSFANLKGSQGNAQIQCSGSYGPDGTQGPLLTMEFRCSDVLLDDALRKALTPESQKLWAELRPRGTIDVLGVNLNYRPGNKQLHLEVDAQKLYKRVDSVQNAIRLEPVWFPYAVDITSGLVRYRDGNLELSKLRGVHDKTKLEADGRCQWSRDGHWSLALDRLVADRLQLDHDLLAALPKDAGSALAKAKFSGALGMTGQINLAGQAGDTSSLDADWDLSFDVEDGRLTGDTPVEHLHGGVRVIGGVEQGRWFSRGELKFDSLFVRDIQVTRVLGPFYVDSKQLLIGSWAERDAKNTPPRRLTAQVFDGLLATDASLSLEEEGKFMLECNLEQASLSRIVQECGSGTAEVSGKTYGILQMTGTTRGKHTWRGGGSVRLRDADIYKVPVMLAMLKLLSVRSPDATAFTTSDIDFRLQGDDVILDRIDLSGDAISLKGRGQLFEQKQVDLLFYTQVGRRDIQALRPLIAEASPNFLLIEVTGTIDNPSVKKTAFPALNETLRELFPDLAQENEARSEPRQILPTPPLWRR